MPNNSEVEVKIAVPSADRGAEEYSRGRVSCPCAARLRVNILWDTADLRLRAQGKLARLREAGRLCTLTFKGKSMDTRHKVREEIETRVENAAAIERVFREVGLTPVFRYEKYRTEYEGDKVHGVVTLDETPIGIFLEIEGSARWIDRTAKQLGFSSADYITASYGGLYLQYCSAHGIQPSNMVFGGKAK